MIIMTKQAIIVFLLFAPTAFAQDDGKSAKQAIEKVEKETGGRVLSASETTIDGQRVIRIKVLSKDGVVRYVNVKAKP